MTLKCYAETINRDAKKSFICRMRALAAVEDSTKAIPFDFEPENVTKISFYK